MPTSMLFADPRFRSPSAVANLHMPRPFVRHYAVGAPTTAADGTVQPAELLLPASRFDHSIGRICGLGQDVMLEHSLRIYSVKPDPKEPYPIGDRAQKMVDELLFECPQFLLNERRLNVETKIDPHLLVARGEVLKVRCDVQMLIWLFGIEKVD